ASQGASAARTSSAYQTVIDPQRPYFDPVKIDMTRATSIEAEPDNYLGAGEGISGSEGKCQPLPAGEEPGISYLESCNDGLKPVRASASCDVPLVAKSAPRSVYDYSCRDWPDDACALFDPYLADGRCRVTDVSTRLICLKAGDGPCTEQHTITVTRLECGEAVAGLPVPAARTMTGGIIAPDETQCAAATAGQTCTLEQETCIDTDPATRDIGGVAVTQTCWKWHRTYSCTGTEHANDCASLAGRPGCTFDHEECLDDPQVGDCQVKDEVYRCTTSSSSASAPASLCGSDLYCLGGECTQVEREASAEFRDAIVAVHAMGDVRDQFDPADLSLFKGEATGCHRPIFGLVNCCAGKSSGLLTASAGAAAIAGGPAAIAALATPFLTQFLCSSEEKLLDVKDRMGLCHYVGTYCSQKVLFVCTAKRKSYCCFPSKLSRILQEQGRAQLRLGWGEARHPDCRGFTVTEFQRLDLGAMNFSEVYADFTQAVKLPDEVATATQI
ncbi:MAG: hypothetical protein B7Y31_10860, partial [Novosphingobium sp. 16-62-11]